MVMLLSAHTRTLKSAQKKQQDRERERERERERDSERERERESLTLSKSLHTERVRHYYYVLHCIVRILCSNTYLWSSSVMLIKCPELSTLSSVKPAQHVQSKSSITFYINVLSAGHESLACLEQYQYMDTYSALDSCKNHILKNSKQAIRNTMTGHKTTKFHYDQ